MVGDKSLFDQVWTLVAPSSWEVPQSSCHVKVIPEQAAGEGRIDICIQNYGPVKQIIGIEVKTAEDSTEPGQLERYWSGLKAEFQDFAIQMSYLTPFNREKAGLWADSLPSVVEFELFEKLNPQTRHVSWLDLESIPWDGNALWQQHRAYVRENISSQDKLRASGEKNRDLASFFRTGPAIGFWEELKRLEIRREGNGAIIDLSAQEDIPFVVESLIAGFEILANIERVVEWDRNDHFANRLRERFLNSEYGSVHAAIFDLARRLDHVWIEGKYDYGVRVTHRDHPSGVSLAPSNGPNELLILVRR